MHTPFLIGSHVYLRPYERGDAPHFVRYLNDPEVRRYTSRDWPLSLVEEEAYLEQAAASHDSVACSVCLIDGDRLIGGAGFRFFNWPARHAGFGIAIGEKDCWNKGLGTEATCLLLNHAFDTLNLNRVWLDVYEFNARAVRVYEKLGFQHEGRLRQDVYRDGQYWDTLRMGILREEWINRAG